MLSELRITNLGVIKNAELRFGPGLNVLTGETGAGKTMILNALSFALGGKVDHKLLRSNSERLTVEVDWKLTSKQMEVLAQLLDSEIDEKSSEITLGRIVDTSGKSRQTVEGSTTNASIINSFSENIIQVFGQNDQRFLNQPGWQIQIIDSLGGKVHLQNLNQYRTLLRITLDLMDQEKQLQLNQSTWLQDREKKQHDLNDFDAIAPQLNEDEEILVAIKNREGVEQNLETFRNIYVLLASEEHLGLIEGLKQLNQLTSSIQDFYDLQDEILSAMKMLDKVEQRVFHSLNIETNERSLSDLYSRKAQLLELTRRHRLPLNELIQEMEKTRNSLSHDISLEEALENVEKDLSLKYVETLELAKEISKERKKIAKDLAEQVTFELAALNMSKTRFIIDVKGISKNSILTLSETNLNQTGADAVEFLIETGDAEPRLIAKSASGGELSRIMLALQVVLQQSNDGLVYVFDEVDSGIGGETAIEVGRRLAKLAQKKQVIVVTHLPQVAAFADHHFCVKGNPVEGISTSDVVTLSDELRVIEIARMLGGMQTDASVTHARELIALK